MEPFGKLPISQRGKLATSAAHYWENIADVLNIDSDSIRNKLHGGASNLDCSRALFRKIADSDITINQVINAFKKLKIGNYLTEINIDISIKPLEEAVLKSPGKSKGGFHYLASLAVSEVGKDLAYLTTVLTIHEEQLRKFLNA